MSDEKPGNPLEKKPDPGEIAAYRHWVMGEIERLMSDGETHVLDAMHKLGLPPAIMYANLSHPVWRDWERVSRSRQLLHPPGELPCLETLRDRAALGLTAAGLDHKLQVMAALADPSTEEGQKVVLELAKLRNQMLPKKVTQKQEGDSVRDEEVRAELKRIREERQRLIEMQEQAIDANFETEDSGDGS